MSIHLYSYIDDLLRLQSDAAEMHNHMGVLGAVREEFVIQVLGGKIDDIKIHKGEVVATAGDMGQHDIIVRRRGTINPDLGGHVRINAADCASVIEVKSNAKATEITAFDNKAAQIKADNSDTICGMVCYKLHNRKDTILKRLGYKFDPDLDGFFPDEEIQNTEYQHIDFIYCLDREYEEKAEMEYHKSFFIKKNVGGSYDLFLDPPYAEYFLMTVNAVANPEVVA